MPENCVYENRVDILWPPELHMWQFIKLITFVFEPLHVYLVMIKATLWQRAYIKTYNVI